MNLFANEVKQELERFVALDWAEQLSNYITLEQFQYIKTKVGEFRRSGVVYPDSSDVFKALKYPFEKVKVVIIGQDPYHNGNADGLAFSCKNSLSPSLSQILQAIFHDLFKGETDPQINNSIMVNMKLYFSNKNNWNLEYLAEQGVLLYNPTLTVNAGSPNSHKGVWRHFTDAVLMSILSKKDIVLMMWGSDAKHSLQHILGMTNPGNDSKNLWLFNEHPAAAAYRKEVWKCNHFTECNKWLKDKNLTEIEWVQR